LTAPRRRLAAAWLLLACCAPALASVTGRVVDEDGRAVIGARVCYFEQNVEQLCSQTVAEGRFELMSSRLETIRVVQQGFTPTTASVGQLDKPIVLERGSALLIELRDAETGEPIPVGSVELVWPTGRKLGPFPTNRGGVRVGSLPRGVVLVTGMAEGYAVSSAAFVELEVGKESTAVIDLRRDAPPPSETKD